MNIFDGLHSQKNCFVAIQRIKLIVRSCHSEGRIGVSSFWRVSFFFYSSFLGILYHLFKVTFVDFAWTSRFLNSC